MNISIPIIPAYTMYVISTHLESLNNISFWWYFSYNRFVAGIMKHPKLNKCNQVQPLDFYLLTLIHSYFFSILPLYKYTG